jgi:hypothetical protein
MWSVFLGITLTDLQARSEAFYEEKSSLTFEVSKTSFYSKAGSTLLVIFARSSLNWLDLSPRETRSNLQCKRKWIRLKEKTP